MQRLLLLITLLAHSVTQAFSQDSLIIKNIEVNRYAFIYEDSGGFSGAGWDSIVLRAAENQYTLVGEIHGVNEVPIFLMALTNEVNFDTFVAEIDPYLSNIIQGKLRNLSEIQLQNWQEETAGNLSFYSYQKDFELLQAFKENGIQTIGIDQITALNDAPVYLHLADLAQNTNKKQLYLKMAQNAQQMLTRIAGESRGAPYLMSDQFEADIQELKRFELSQYELEVLEKLKFSREIYTSKEGHQKRIKLMKNQLMSQYDTALLDKKALFRLGANHSTKGESLMTIFDIGNLAHNLAESQFNSSYHLALFAKAGYAGHPFIGNPDTEVKLPKELSFLTSLAYEDKWTYFDFTPLRKQIESGKIQVANEYLRRIFNGYDGLVMIPSSTAGQHF